MSGCPYESMPIRTTAQEPNGHNFPTHYTGTPPFHYTEYDFQESPREIGISCSLVGWVIGALLVTDNRTIPVRPA